jgi:hypothetical protein
VAVAVGDFDNDGLMDLAAVSNGANLVSILRQDPTAPGTFSPSLDVGVGLGPGVGLFPNSLALGDLNGDGRLDFVTGNSDSISVRLQRTNGTFGFAPALAVSTGGVAARGVAIADLNGDGRLDIAAALPTQNSARVFLQTPRVPGTFALTTTQPSGGAGLVIADLNGDGRLDAASADFLTDQLVISFQNPGLPGTFLSNTTVAVTDVPIDVDAGDLDGDGRVDLVTANENTNDVAVMLQDSFIDGNFSAQQKYATATGPRAVRIADVTGDGRLDLVVVANSANVVSVLAQSPSSPGTFLPRVDLPVGAQPLGLAVGDLNGDGAPDIVVSNSGAANVSLLMQNPASPGTFFAAVTRAVQENPRGVALGDLDGDGRTDIVVANQRLANLNTGTFSILLQSATAPGTFPTITNVSANNTTMGVALADLNDDGRLDVATTGTDALHLSVWLQSTAAAGALNPRVTYTSANSTTVRAVDFDLDGRMDLVTMTGATLRVYSGQ